VRLSAPSCPSHCTCCYCAFHISALHGIFKVLLFSPLKGLVISYKQPTCSISYL